MKLCVDCLKGRCWRNGKKQAIALRKSLPALILLVVHLATRGMESLVWTAEGKKEGRAEGMKEGRHSMASIGPPPPWVFWLPEDNLSRLEGGCSKMINIYKTTPSRGQRWKAMEVAKVEENACLNFTFSFRVVLVVCLLLGNLSSLSLICSCFITLVY